MSTEADQYLARITDPGAAIEAIITAFIDGLVSDGIWAAADAIYLSKGLVDSTSALQNVKSSSFTGVLVDAPTFSQRAGFTYDGSNDAFDTNYNPSTAGGNWTQNSGCMWAYCNTAGLTAGPLCGTPVSDTRMFPNVGGNAFFRMNTADGSSTAANTNTVGLFAANRSNSTTVQGYIRGSQAVSDGTKNSNSLANEDVNIARASSSFIAANIPIAGFGGSMSSTLHGNLNTRVTTLLAAIDGALASKGAKLAAGMMRLSGGLS